VSQTKLKAEPRTEFGKGAARRIRRAHKIPAVLYGHGEKPQHIALPGHETMLALKHANALLDLEIEGARRVRDEVPGAVTIFVDAPLPELERRLVERATESSGEIGERIELARRQKQTAAEFDHVIENDVLERALAELGAIVQQRLDAAATMSPS
jgi:large subunit ribosomal protein L25